MASLRVLSKLSIYLLLKSSSCLAFSVARNDEEAGFTSASWSITSSPLSSATCCMSASTWSCGVDNVVAVPIALSNVCKHWKQNIKKWVITQGHKSVKISPRPAHHIVGIELVNCITDFQTSTIFVPCNTNPGFENDNDHFHFHKSCISSELTNWYV